MKSTKSVAVIVLVIGLCFILLPKTSKAEQEAGIGGKLIGEVPFLIGSLDFNQFGIEVGGGMRSTSTSYGTYSSSLSLTYYLANGRYIVTT